MMNERKVQSPEPFWSIDHDLCDVIWQGEPLAVRMKAHLSHKRYSGPRAINPLLCPAGERVYLLTHLFTAVPEIRITVGLYPQPTDRDAIGEVIAATLDGMRHELVGSGQAWYYPADRTILLWELLPHGRLRTEDPLPDERLRALWHGFERVLIEQFPDATHMATPSWEPEYDIDVWRQFLASLGYVPHPMEEQVYIKAR